MPNMMKWLPKLDEQDRKHIAEWINSAKSPRYPNIVPSPIPIDILALWNCEKIRAAAENYFNKRFPFSDSITSVTYLKLFDKPDETVKRRLDI